MAATNAMAPANATVTMISGDHRPFTSLIKVKSGAAYQAI
jgi:hypothetical protein